MAIAWAEKPDWSHLWPTDADEPIVAQRSDAEVRDGRLVSTDDGFGHEDAE